MVAEAISGEAQGNLPPEALVEGVLAVHLEHAALAVQAAAQLSAVEIDRVFARAGVAIRSSRLATPAARKEKREQVNTLRAKRWRRRASADPVRSAR